MARLFEGKDILSNVLDRPNRRKRQEPTRQAKRRPIVTFSNDGNLVTDLTGTGNYTTNSGKRYHESVFGIVPNEQNQ